MPLTMQNCVTEFLLPSARSYADPAFVEEMMDATADFIIAMMGRILDHTDVDVYGFWEDTAYKTGPLIGPEMARFGARVVLMSYLEAEVSAFLGEAQADRTAA